MQGIFFLESNFGDFLAFLVVDNAEGLLVFLVVESKVIFLCIWNPHACLMLRKCFQGIWTDKLRGYAVKS